MVKIYQAYKICRLLSLVTLVGVFTGFIIQSTTDTPSRVQLTHPALRFIDGVPYGIDAKAIQNILGIRKKVREMQVGVYDKVRNEYLGRYTVNGKKYCLKLLVAVEKEFYDEFLQKKEELNKQHVNTATFRHAWILHEAELEKELEKKLVEQEAISLRRHSNEEQQLLEAKKLKRKIKREYTERMEEDMKVFQLKYMNDSLGYEKKLSALQQEHAKKIAPFKSLLEQIKKELMMIAEPFIEQARSAKEFLLPLMEEWAEKSGRAFSPLLRWHEEDNGTEVEIFLREAQSFYRVDVFCSDLVDFNESIVYSCPRGYKQFMELLSTLKPKL